MRILFNTYPMAFASPGGGERQLLDIYNTLPVAGMHPMLFDLWNPRFDEVAVVHFFSVVGGSSHFCRFTKDLGIPLVINPNLWITRKDAVNYETDEIAYQLSLADKIIVNSETEASHYKDVFDLPDNKIQVIHVGIASSFFEKADPSLAASVLGIEKPFVLCVGSFHPRKNQLALIRVMKKFPQYVLVLLGHIRDEEYANICLQEGGEQVIYAGTIPRSAALLRSAMASCAAFVVPSFVESPSIAALEAAAQGSKIVITRIGSAHEYFGDLAHYIDPYDIDNISKTLEEALKNHNQDQNRELIDLVNRKFSIEGECHALASLYRSIL